jgi:hypothetical protein
MPSKRPTNKLTPDVVEPIFGLRPIGLRRDVNAYTLTESEVNSLGAAGVRLTVYLWLAGIGLSFAASAVLTGATVAKPWSGQQWALFYYSPRFSFALGIAFAVLSAGEILGRWSEVRRIKREHRIPAEVRAIPPE